MKKSLFFSYLLLMNIPLFSIEKLKPHPRPKPEMTIFQAYFFMKEFLYGCLIMPFWLNLEQVNKSGIFCCTCDFKLDVLESYGYFAAAGNYKIISTLKRLFYKADIDEINKYLLKVNIQEERECVRCRDYCGWTARGGLFRISRIRS